METILDTIEILLIEDNVNDAELTMRALNRSKISELIHINHLKDGEEAINYLFPIGNENAGPKVHPKVILLDLKLPKVDGIQILRELKSHDSTRNIPVVVLTSSQEERDIVDSYHLGVNSYVTKPVVYEKFMEEVANLGMYWGSLNQSPK
jgi:two-component system response regulator